jgi:hypothetical protein
MRLLIRSGTLGTFFCLATAGACSGQADLWASVPFSDPLRFSSLPVSGTEVIVPAAGQWQLSTTVSYFNVWQLTWHTKATHRGFGLVRKPLTEREIAILEQNFPSDQFYHIDLEGSRTDLLVSGSFGAGYAATLRIPWINVGAPHWDAIAEDFHNRLGLTNAGRELFPRGQTTVYVRGRHGAIDRLSGLDGSGLGDSSLSVTGPLGHWIGGEQRWALALEAPTGQRDTLRGSGGWDWGVRWFGTWGTDRRAMRVALGYTWLDSGGSWLGVKRDNTWGALIEGHAPLGQRITLRGSARFDSSPLASFTDSEIGKTSFYWTVGALTPVAAGAWVAFDVGENYGSSAEVPDFSLHLQFGVKLPPAR